MWGDTLLAIERAHMLRLIAWGALSIIAGTTILIITKLRRSRPDLLRSFAIQCVLWGIGVAAVAGWRNAVVTIPDVAGAARIERLAWLQIGLYAGFIVTGLSVAATGWRIARSLAAVGSGLGLLLQGVALLVFDLMLVVQVTR